MGHTFFVFPEMVFTYLDWMEHFCVPLVGKVQDQDFSGEGQIVKLAWRNRFAISDIENHRIQIVEIDFQSRTMKVLNIIGTNFFYKPLGLVEMENSILAFSHDDGCAYVWDGERTFQVLDRRFCGARFACKLPDGSIAVCNKNASVVQTIKENYSVPSGIDCLDVKFREKRKKCLTNSVNSSVQTSFPMTNVADSGVQTSDPSTQVDDSSVQTDVRITIVAESSVQTNSPTESIFERLSKIFEYFFGYQLF